MNNVLVEKHNRNIKAIINHTNARLENWYVNAKEDYGVIGSAKCSYNKEIDAIIIVGEENGEKLNFACTFYREGRELEYIFNIWMESPNYGEELFLEIIKHNLTSVN